MKKNIGYVSMDSSAAEWLKNNLPPGELRDAFRNLISGEYSSLIVERNSAEDGTELIPSSHIIECGTLVIDTRARRVEQEGKDVSLTPKEFDILAFLASNRGEVFTKEQIYQAVWDGEYMLDDSNIMAFIRKIRKKIEPEPDSPRYILTIWGIGYRFTDEI